MPWEETQLFPSLPVLANGPQEKFSSLSSKVFITDRIGPKFDIYRYFPRVMCVSESLKIKIVLNMFSSVFLNLYVCIRVMQF